MSQSMKRNSQALSILLRQFADLLENLDDQDVEKIIRYHSKLLISGTDASKSLKKISPAPLSNTDIDTVRNNLKTVSTRETAEALLNEWAPKKAQLEAVAKALSVPVQKIDTADQIKNKIIDATVGYRLRSHAIRGEDTSR